MGSLVYVFKEVSEYDTLGSGDNVMDIRDNKFLKRAIRERKRGRRDTQVQVLKNKRKYNRKKKHKGRDNEH